jgi:ssDNA-binding Zn-finger/Zn-ribbon topoisomerase 1
MGGCDRFKLKCVRCNGYVVERINKSTKEKFYGCSNFPKCKFSRSIKLRNKFVDYGDELRPY